MKRGQTVSDKRMRYLFDALLILVILAVLLGKSLWGKTPENTDTEPMPPSQEAATVYIHTVDVGQGDCTLIRAPEGDILIDAGPNDAENALCRYLDAQGVTTLRYCIFTHPHEDHIGGGDRIVRDYTVEEVIMTSRTSDSHSYERLLTALEESQTVVTEAQAGDTYTLGDLSFTLLGPITCTEQTDMNDCSIVTRFVFGDTAFLLTGDAQKAEEAEMLDRFGAEDFDSDWMKLGHHGSSSSGTEPFLKAVSPEIVVISCGKNNDYGHPHRETLAAIRTHGYTSYRTDEDGSLVFRCDGHTITYCP